MFNSDIEPVRDTQVPEGCDGSLVWYANPRKIGHSENVRWMRPHLNKLMANEGVVFWHPAKEVAPWHMQCVINGQLINVWPCAAKAQIDGQKSMQGKKRVVEMFINALAHEPEPDFDPIDDGDSYD